MRGREPETDRVLATVLFTDIVGSTERATLLGDGMARARRSSPRAIRRELARFRGREIDTAGDGFFAAFDGPARAIRGAIGDARTPLGELDSTVRIGLHAGECERVGGGLRGVAVHVGARIGAAAEPGEILVSSTVRDLVAGSGIGFERRRHARAEGRPRGVAAVPGGLGLRPLTAMA